MIGNVDLKQSREAISTLFAEKKTAREFYKIWRAYSDHGGKFKQVKMEVDVQ